MEKMEMEVRWAAYLVSSDCIIGDLPETQLLIRHTTDHHVVTLDNSRSQQCLTLPFENLQKAFGITTPYGVSASGFLMAGFRVHPRGSVAYTIYSDPRYKELAANPNIKDFSPVNVMFVSTIHYDPDTMTFVPY